MDPKGFEPRRRGLRSIVSAPCRICPRENSSALPLCPRKQWSPCSPARFVISPCLLISPPRFIVHRTRFGGSTFPRQTFELVGGPVIFLRSRVRLFRILIKNSTPKRAVFDWWTRRDSNPRPLGCEPNALPTELRARVPAYYNPCVRFCQYRICNKKQKRDRAGIRLQFMP